MRELADEFLRDVEGRPELPETGVAHRLCGVTSWCSGDFIDARQHLERALACYDNERDRPLAVDYGVDLAVLSMAYLASTLWRIGMGNRARCLIEKNIAHAVQTKHIPTVANAYGHAAGFEMMRRDHERSAEYAQALLGLAREHGLSAWLPYIAFHQGWLCCRAGEHSEGVTQMRQSLQPLREQGGYPSFLPLGGVLLAEAEAAAGHHDAALATIDAELARMTRAGMCMHLAEALRVRGELLLKSNPDDIEGAEAAFTEAIDVARCQSAKRFEFRAAIRLARLWMPRAKRVEHQGLLAILADGLADGSGFDGFSDTQAPPE
jgi:predicted ATPase